MIATAALLDFIRERAAGAEERLPCHWIGGTGDVKRFPHDAAADFCRECAESEISDYYEAHPELASEDDERALFVDGGWGTEHDSPPYCEVCGDPLIGHLTEYGVEQELEHFEDHAPGLDYPMDWDSFANAVEGLDDDDERWSWIAEHVADAQAELAARAQREAELAAALGMADARADLLILLSARAAQQARKPSYRLWPELLEYMGTRWALARTGRDGLAEFDEAPRTRARLRRMEREAETFLANFGYHRGGWDCFKAPYGEYTWSFVVEIEQRNLWGQRAFIEGRDAPHTRCGTRVRRRKARRHPRGHRRPQVIERRSFCDHPYARDANPYPEGTDDHRAWDCGYIYASKDRS